MTESLGYPFLRDLWRRSAGLPPIPSSPYYYLPSAKEVRKYNSEMSKKFRALCDNRLVVGAYRYGPLLADDKPHYNRVSVILSRLQEYKQTGNTELLVDIANLAFLEFLEGEHPKRHFKARSRAQHDR